MVMATDKNSLAKRSHPVVNSFWRVITGHENGQILLWHPFAQHLSPLLMIGEPASPVRYALVLTCVCIAVRSQ